MLATPKSLDEEHEELMSGLKSCALHKNGVGRAVSDLLQVLRPHFEKEQKLVMPLLGSISDLVSGEKISNLGEIAGEQSALLSEYQKMFEEHGRVRVLISKAKKAALEERDQETIDLLEGLAHHARIEEEVLYPSALLAGTVAKCLSPPEQSGGIA